MALIVDIGSTGFVELIKQIETENGASAVADAYKVNTDQSGESFFDTKSQ